MTVPVSVVFYGPSFSALVFRGETGLLAFSISRGRRAGFSRLPSLDGFEVFPLHINGSQKRKLFAFCGEFVGDKYRWPWAFWGRRWTSYGLVMAMLQQQLGMFLGAKPEQLLEMFQARKTRRVAA